MSKNKIVKTVPVAFGNRKLRRELTFSYDPKTNVYEVRMSGETEYLQLTETNQVGRWQAEVMVVSRGCVHGDGVLSYGKTARLAYIAALDLISWR